MQTRRCPNCHKLQRASAQQCSRCGEPFGRKRLREQLSRVSQPSLPIASPHRAGHYFGLHPEDQPYQSNKLVTVRHHPELPETTLYEGQEPTHIVLPSTDSAPALKLYREALLPPHSDIDQQQTQRPKASVTVATPVDVSARRPRPTFGLRRPIFSISRRVVSSALIVSCVLFLLAASIITLGHLGADRSGQNRTFSTSITVQSAPAGEPGLKLSMTSLDLGSAASGVVSAQSVKLSNLGGGLIAWQASSDQPWLTFSPASGTFAGQTEVEVAVNRGVLAPQQYTGHIQFSQQARQSSIVTLTVTMAVTPAPARLSVSTTTLSCSTPAQQDPADQSITIRNDGGQSMSWSATTTTDDGAPWLSLSPASGALAPGTQATLPVHVDSHTLPVGSYSGLLTFGGEASARVRVSLSVVAPGNLVASPSMLSFSALAGQPTNAQSLTLQNSGQLSLDWSAAVATLDGGNWLTIAPDHGSLAGGEQTTLQVSASATTLTPGAYQGTLTFSVGGLTKTISISFAVTAPVTPSPSPTSITTPSPSPAISVQPGTLQITTVKGQQPATVQINVTNTGQGVLHWSAKVDDHSAPYIAVSPAQGSLNPGQSITITLTVDVSQVSASEMVATLTVVDADSSTQVASRSMLLDVLVQGA